MDNTKLYMISVISSDLWPWMTLRVIWVSFRNSVSSKILHVLATTFAYNNLMVSFTHLRPAHVRTSAHGSYVPTFSHLWWNIGSKSTILARAWFVCDSWRSRRELVWEQRWCIQIIYSLYGGTFERLTEMNGVAWTALSRTKTKINDNSLDNNSVSMLSPRRSA